MERIILCAGKVYYDLANWREENARDDVAILRLEQLYPFPEEELYEAIKDYTNVTDAVWCQEEPLNQAPGIPASITCGLQSND